MRTVTTHRHSNRRLQGYTLIATAAFLLAAQAGFAQEMPPPAQTQLAAGQNTDPPGRVARLNYMSGAVTTEPAGATDWSYAQINRPLTTGDQLWNDQNARSELHIGSTAVRLGSSTSLDVLNLDDNSAQLKVAQGTLSTRVRELAPGSSYEIDTPNLALGLNGPGDYRVDVAPDGSSTTVTVRSGSATVYGDAGQVPVAAGQQIRFAGTNLQQLADNGVPGLDSLDQWAASRDAAEDRSVSAQYVSRDIPGYEDLDANGTWQDSPQYGEVWVPRATPAGWAPYHDGHWVWQAPWGWTWVDDEPWGFAPYHYGRWAQVDDTWAWVPGPLVADAPPVYAPALVAFVGDGGGGVDWGVSLAVGGALAAGVAWFPLGPGEPWHPHWGGHDNWSPGYYNRINRTTIVNNYNRNVNIHNMYINYRVPGGVTAVPATAFVHGQPVGRFAQKVDPQQWRNARINPGGPGIAPVRESLGPGLRNANYRPPAAVIARPVVATRSPAMPAAYHDNLAQRFAQNGGRVPGAGQPIVRTMVPARMAGGPGALPVQNVRVVQSHIAGHAPGAVPGAPMPGGENRMQQAGQRPGETPAQQRGAAAQARPGMPPQMSAQMSAQNGHGQPAEMAHPSNGVPRPPQANGGGNPGAYAQQHGVPQQGGQPMNQQAGEAGRREPAWTQPHTPMAQQPQQGQRGGPQEQAGRPGFAQQPGAQAEAGMQERGVPHPAGNPAMQQQIRQQEARAPQAQAPAQEQRQQDAQRQQQIEQQRQQQAQQQQEQRMQEQRQQQAQQQQEQRMQQQRQQQAQQQQEQRMQQQRQQQAQQQQQEQRMQQQRQQQEQRVQQQPHPQQPQQQQHAEQHSNGGNRDEHHKS